MCHILFLQFYRKKNYGHKVCRGEVWIAAHKHANGVFVNDEARKIIVSSILIKSIISHHTSCYFMYGVS